MAPDRKRQLQTALDNCRRKKRYYTECYYLWDMKEQNIRNQLQEQFGVGYTRWQKDRKK